MNQVMQVLQKRINANYRLSKHIILTTEIFIHLVVLLHLPTKAKRIRFPLCAGNNEIAINILHLKI